MENALTGVAGKKFILSYSCGKDSTLCLHKMLEAGAEPMALLVMFNPEAGRSYFHGVDPALLKEYGEALELPLLAVPTGGEEYHLSMEAALRRAKEQGVELVCFGDIDIGWRRYTPYGTTTGRRTSGRCWIWGIGVSSRRWTAGYCPGSCWAGSWTGPWWRR